MAEGGGGGGEGINSSEIVKGFIEGIKNNLNVNVETNYSGYKHSNTQSSDGVYARGAMHSSNKTI